VDWQLRIYTIKEGELDAWLEEWLEHVAPLRRRLGFQVVGPWIDRDGSTFVWLIGYDGADGFATANERYYESPERRALEPDPARHIATVETRMLRDPEAPA
jgi:hypothetical protein